MSPRLDAAAGKNTPATIGLTFGVIAIFGNLLFLPSIAALVFGIVGVKRSSHYSPRIGRKRSVWAVVLGVLGVVSGVMWLGLMFGSDEPNTVPAITTNTGSSTEGQIPDLAEFGQLDADGWAQIAKAPDAAQGQKVIVFAEVTQFDSATGADAFLANAGAIQPSAQFELETNTFFTGEESVIADVTAGDIVKVYAVVEGSFEYETQIGGNTTAPQLSVVAIEDVGFKDLTVDVVASAPKADEYGATVVPLAVTNSASEMMTYSVELVAESADGATRFGTASAYVENLGVGQTVNVDAEFYDEIPADAVIKVVEVSRYGN